MYLDCCFCTLLKYFRFNSLSKSDGHKSTLVDPGKMSLLSGNTCNQTLPNKCQYPLPQSCRGLSWHGSTWGNLSPTSRTFNFLPDYQFQKLPKFGEIYFKTSKVDLCQVMKINKKINLNKIPLILEQRSKITSALDLIKPILRLLSLADKTVKEK